MQNKHNFFLSSWLGQNPKKTETVFSGLLTWWSNPIPLLAGSLVRNINRRLSTFTSVYYISVISSFFLLFDDWWQQGKNHKDSAVDSSSLLPRPQYTLQSHWSRSEISKQWLYCFRHYVWKLWSQNIQECDQFTQILFWTSFSILQIDFL